MASSDVAPPANILAPTYRALQYAGMIAGQSNKLIDYYVEATDAKGNVTRSDIQHVWVGGSTISPPATGGQFVMDGVLDADAREVASKNGMRLYCSMHGGKLYVATNDAGEGSDHFIYVADTPGAMRAANWAKSGQIAQWSAYLADENDNNYSAWFDAHGAAQAATGTNGGVLEGTLDLAGQFGGAIPPAIYLAVGLYASADGGTLLYTHQLPGTLDNDGNIQANEYLRLVLPQGWALGGGGDWNTAWNWTDVIPNAAGANARFLNVIATPSTVTAATNVTAGHVFFDSPYGYTLGGSGSLTLEVTSGLASIDVGSGTQQIQLPTTVNDNTLATVAPAATLRFTGPLNLANGSILTTTGGGSVEISGAVTASGGAALRVNGAIVTADADLNGAALLVDAGEARLRASQHLSSLTVAAGAKATLSHQPTGRLMQTASLSVAGQFDLTDNKLVITAGDVGAITALIASGRNGGAWNGNGIITSLASGNFTTLAIATAQQAGRGGGTFAGLSVADGDVLVMFTYGGDANLDGTINIDDYGRIDTSVGIGLTGWYNGDFNYDGNINIDDYGIIDVNVGIQGSPFSTSEGVAALAPTAVPEPTVGGIIALSAVHLLGRRQSRRRRTED
jgi:hypothetical protein